MFFVNLVVSVVFLLITGCNGDITPQRYVHKAVAIMDKNALFAEGPLWESAKKQALSSTPETMDEAYKTVREALETAGGKHSFLMERSTVQYNDTLQWRMPSESNLTAEYIAKVQGVERKAPISPQIAILTDGDTASSGEARLICFRGLGNVKTFGSPTAGYASANRTFDMGDGSILVITTSCDVARTGEVFCDNPIVLDSLTNEPMDAALEWLRISH